MTPEAVGPTASRGDALSAKAPDTPSIVQPSASYSITMRVRQRQRPGAFARVAGAIGETGAILGAIDLVRAERSEVIRDVTVACVDAAHDETVVQAVEAWTTSSSSGSLTAHS